MACLSDGGPAAADAASEEGSSGPGPARAPSHAAGECGMGGVTRTIRLVVGLGMIAAGATLAAPAGLQLAAWGQAGQTAAEKLGPLPPPVVRSAPVMNRQPAPPLADGSPRRPPLSSLMPDADRRPPPPPEPLPPVAPAAAGADPGLQSSYRSTLDVPPPPLLDAQRPPPLAVGWTGRARPVEPSRRSRPAAGPAAPSRWRVRDGDDLNGIANRVYGTPLAATALWEANRGILSDPRLLPIGVEIALPPAAAIWPARPGQAVIEPAARSSLPAQPPGDDSASAWLPRGSGPVAGAEGG